MKKTGTPWYRSSHDAWYVWHEGRQVPLAKGKEGKAEAYARFAELLGAAPRASPLPSTQSVRELVAAFLDAANRTVKPTTREAYRCVLQDFLRQFGEQEVLSVGAEAVEAWAGQRPWSQTTQRYALTVLGSAYRWAAREGRIPHNPLRTLRRPAGRSRGSSILIGDDLHARLLKVVSPEFRDFLQAVRDTGARPGEVAKVEAKHVVWDAACWVLGEHKTARKTGRERIIHLPPGVLDTCRRLARHHPTGPLFRNTRGQTWRKTGWKQAMARAQKKLDLGVRPMVSGYRHTFATDALAGGVSDAQVAELLGHADTSMIHRHYGHLSARGRALKDALKQIR
jgi:integrase